MVHGSRFSTTLKILTLSAYYPPYTYGGYEIRVSDIMDGLSRRGHEICVLTTKRDLSLKVASKNFPYPVVRRLHSPARKMRFLDWLTTRKVTRWLGVGLVFLRETWHDIRDTALLDAEIRAFKPDVIYLGHIMPLTRVFIPYLSELSIPIVADEGGKGLIYSWEDHGLWQRFLAEFPKQPAMLARLKELLASVVERLSKGLVGQDWAFPRGIKAFFNSRLNARNAEIAGVPLAESKVIHSGIDTEFFTFERVKDFGSPLTILVPGRLEENKRQLDAVRLGALLKEKGIPFELVVVGERWNNAYADQVEVEIYAAELQKEVRILPMVERAVLVELYHWADVTFFPSIYQSGFSRISLEAMACGSLVISYGCEGSDEIIEDGENGFLLPKYDPHKAATLLGQLLCEEQMVKQIQLKARTTIEKRHSMTCYISQVEEFLNQ